MLAKVIGELSASVVSQKNAEPKKPIRPCDTTGFSRVVIQLLPNKTQSWLLTPPTLVAWCFNFGLWESLVF
jgi:hypothetical protein